MQIYTKISQVSAIISIPFSMSVVLTALLFPSMRKNKIFMELIALTSLAAMLGNWPYLSGTYPLDGTDLCTFEGFCSLYFYPVSWILTAIILTLLVGLITTNKMILSRLQIYVIGFCLPLLLSLLLLTTNHFGALNSVDGKQVCTYGGNPLSGQIWHDISFNSVLLVSFGVMFYCLVYILYLEYSDPEKTQCQTYQVTKRAVILYPVLLLFCWVPYVVVTFMGLHGSTSQVAAVCVGLKILHGATIAMVFFANSSEARQRWLSLFTCKDGILLRDPTIAYSDFIPDFYEDDELMQRIANRNSDFRESFHRQSEGELVRRATHKSSIVSRSSGINDLRTSFV